MSICALCGFLTDSRDELCTYHVGGHGSSSPGDDDWAAGNRIMCDFLHRGIVMPAGPAPRVGVDRPLTPTWTELVG
jgi:hypothetical protein